MKLRDVCSEMTDVEWEWVIHLERIRGATINSLARELGVSRSVVLAHWETYSPYKFIYYDSENRLMHYFDICYSRREKTLTNAELASLMDMNVEDVASEREKWWTEVSGRLRWPVPCERCEMVGSWENIILENGLCIECNAEDNGWPLEEWKLGGEYVALLEHLGVPIVISEEIYGGSDELEEPSDNDCEIDDLRT